MTTAAGALAGMVLAEDSKVGEGVADKGAAKIEPGRIMTVTGPVGAEELGRTLMHEHVVVDFIGAGKDSLERYDEEMAFETALPHFQKLKEHGVRSVVECTPRHIGRHVALLRRLSEASGVRIITNTGWYAAVNRKFLPPEAENETEERIAERWLGEWREGIVAKGGKRTEPVVYPGFLKLGTGSGPLPGLEAKLVKAAARAHRASGLTIAIHTGDGVAALDEIRLLREAGVAPGALIWVHAMNDPGKGQIEAAKLGAWVSLDGYSLAPHNVLRFPDFLTAHRDAGTLHRVLLSHDDGWAVEGGAASNNKLALFGNGNPAPYQSIFTRLLPDLRDKGFTDRDFDQLLVTNPREALTIRPRLTA
ncbi:MAG: phosphotriesterase [Verrucomicrobiota bacterium]